MDREIALVAHAQALTCEMHAAVARIESMKAMNAARADQGLAQAYGEESFYEQSEVLQGIAKQLHEIAEIARNA